MTQVAALRARGWPQAAGAATKLPAAVLLARGRRRLGRRPGLPVSLVGQRGGARGGAVAGQLGAKAWCAAAALWGPPHVYKPVAPQRPKAQHTRTPYGSMSACGHTRRPRVWIPVATHLAGSYFNLGNVSAFLVQPLLQARQRCGMGAVGGCGTGRACDGVGPAMGARSWSWRGSLRGCGSR